MTKKTMVSTVNGLSETFFPEIAPAITPINEFICQQLFTSE